MNPLKDTPWRVYRETKPGKNGTTQVFIQQDVGLLFATVVDHNEAHAIATANVMAKSPEMLDLLKRMVAYYGPMRFFDEVNSMTHEQMIAEANALIAKAAEAGGM